MQGQNTYLALEAIGQAIRDIHEPRGTATESGPLGTTSYDTFAGPPEQLGAVTEDLIGAAFVLAQTYVNSIGGGRTQIIENVCHVANYWKHRDQWPVNWGDARNHEKSTVAAVRLMGITSTAPGQITRVAETALGQRFDVVVLWTVISSWASTVVS